LERVLSIIPLPPLYVSTLCRILIQANQERDHAEDLGIDVRIILEWILEKGWEVLDWIHVFLGKYQRLKWIATLPLGDINNT
jgi:hypothetical protein